MQSVDDTKKMKKFRAKTSLSNVVKMFIKTAFNISIFGNR